MQLLAVETRYAQPHTDFDWRVASPEREFTRDFDGQLYTWEHTDISYEQIVEHLRRYLVEKLMKPARQEMWVGFNGELDPEYEKRMQNAIDYWTERGDVKAVSQFSQELAGMRNMAILVARNKQDSGNFPNVVVASHPGDFYVGKNSFRKVVTNIGVGGEEVAGGYIYSYITVPSHYVSIAPYYDHLQMVSDVNATSETLQQAMGPLSAEALVAFPLLLRNHVRALENLATYLGYESWEAIEALAAQQMLDMEDPVAFSRREAMVTDLARRLWDAKTGGDEQMLADISDAAGTLFAMEYGSVYRGKGVDFVRGEVERMLRVVVAQRTKVFEMQNATVWMAYNPDFLELLEYRNRMTRIMQTNLKVQEGMATGCGGANNFLQGGYGQESYDTTTYAGFEMMSIFGYQEGTTTSTSTAQLASEIVVTLSSGETYTLKVKEGEKCLNCGAKSGHTPLCRIGPCGVCENCDPNVHRAD